MSNLNLQKLREWVWLWPWTFEDLPDTTRAAMPSPCVIKRMLRNKRTSKYPAQPSTLADLVVANCHHGLWSSSQSSVRRRRRRLRLFLSSHTVHLAEGASTRYGDQVQDQRELPSVVRHAGRLNLLASGGRHSWPGLVKDASASYLRRSCWIFRRDLRQRSFPSTARQGCY